MGKDMKSQTNLVRRGQIYYFRRRVPPGLVAHYGKQEVTYSLRTKDPKEAREKVRLEALKWDQEFNHIAALQVAPVAVELSDHEIAQLAALWYAHLLEEDEAIRMDGLSDRAFDEYGGTLGAVESVTASMLAKGRIGDDWLTFEVGDFLEAHGVKIQPDTETWQKTAFAFLKTYRKALEAKQARQQGEVVDTPKAEPPVIRSLPLSREGDTLEALFEYWKTQGEKRPRTLLEARKAVQDFQELHPALSASRIEKRHVVAFKDKLLEGKAPATVTKQVKLLQAILETAANNDKLPSNPAHGVKIPKPKAAQKARIPYSPEDLTAIFRSEVFTEGKRPAGGKGEAAYWIPLLGLWTGARLEELGGLLVDDIQEEEGIPYIRITEYPEQGRLLKTAGSRRRVPIHPELIRCGFLEYVQATKGAGHPRLFPKIASGDGRQQTASFSQWWGRYCRRVVKITDPRKVFHSFRHGFKDACHACDIRKEIGDKLTGHASRDVGDSYGGEDFPLAPLAEGMGRLRYKGLDLSHLRK